MNASRVVSSAIWAAYADALGFITEFRDANGVRRKFSEGRVTEPLPWERRIGGKFGPTIELPPGCYSDDTQLRLATSRSIRGDGTFDVEAFAKVELPVFLAYHLGAGRGTKAAARNLERKDVTWYSNFFVDDGISYLQSGGNGAAMRIQPHVWAEPAQRRGPSTLALNVFRNAITTHGHPRGFLGAFFHAQCLHLALGEGRLSTPDDWMSITDRFDQVSDLVSSDEHLDRVWRPTWEQQKHQSLRDAIQEVQDEHRKDILLVTKILARPDARDSYLESLVKVGGLDKETMGSGTKTALLAAVLAFLFRESRIEDAVIVASNALGSDTDTIATMAGALLGSLATEMPRIPPLDVDYLIKESERLANISEGRRVSSFSYPDLLYWRAPKTQLDVVGVVDGIMVVAGLGPASSSGRVAKSPKQQNVGWEWMRLSFGQTVLAKRRAKLPNLPPYIMPQPPLEPSRPARVEPKAIEPTLARPQPSRHETPATRQRRDAEVVERQPSLFDKTSKDAQLKLGQRSLDRLTDYAIRHDFHPVAVGKSLLEIIDNSITPIEDAIAFVAIVAKARVHRLRGRLKDEQSRDEERGKDR